MDYKTRVLWIIKHAYCGFYCETRGLVFLKTFSMYLPTWVAWMRYRCIFTLWMMCEEGVSARICILKFSIAYSRIWGCKKCVFAYLVL